jgi:hypothetical protein
LLRAPISVDIPRKLWQPVVDIATWRTIVLGATVEEATINKGGNSASREYNVGPNRGAAQDHPEVLAEP